MRRRKSYQLPIARDSLALVDNDKKTKYRFGMFRTLLELFLMFLILLSGFSDFFFVFVKNLLRKISINDESSSQNSWLIPSSV